ncbi:hypothetical protein CHL78_009280 [Romboutsia weinsteinii]|uniref:N-acetylmuramoyl-L-alanine amidase n=1 Tax=Romboutsia weinsteinii TaxID=2020949 RepID=A0A371J3Z5_9FIRM|nr:N-acetylmuramoyl-L-alanine amidase [Romboutsia weinsteinii]RDY27398.1 hypothetical protein CHL78_009280 [Romboutsia weinsteinii]
MKFIKKIFASVLTIGMVISSNISAYADFDLEDGRNHIIDIEQTQEQGDAPMPYVFNSYEKNATFYLYNNVNIKMYNTPSTSSQVVGELEPQMLVATKRKGNYFYIDTYAGYKWIYKDDNVQLREIENMNNEQFTTSTTLNLHSKPFDIFKTEVQIPVGTYSIKNKAGDWFYIDNGNVSGWFYTENGKFPNSVSTMDKTNILGVPLKVKLAKISNNVRPANPMKPKYITIHNTANTGKGANASAHANLLYNNSINGGSYTSWHFTADDKEIYQSLPMNEIGYHAGDGSGPGNRSSIGIEICENSDGNYMAAEENGAKLAAQLLHELNLPVSSLRMHKDFSGKNCPAKILGRDNGWNSFVSKVQKYYNDLVPDTNKYYIDMFSFPGEQSVLDAKNALGKATGWYLEHKKISLDNTQYRIVTGEFGSEEQARNAVSELQRIGGWWSKYEPTGSPGKFRVVTGTFTGEEQVKSALQKIQSKTGWWVKYESVGDANVNYSTTPIYRIVTGEFNNLEMAKKAVQDLSDTMGWWSKYEPTSNPGKYRVVTGGFMGEASVKNAMNTINSKFGWWTRAEETGEFVYNYRLVTGDFNSKSQAYEKSDWIKNNYGWYNQVKVR